MISLPLQKLPNNVEDLGKLVVAKVLKSCPKSNKSPNLVTLITTLNLVRLELDSQASKLVVELDTTYLVKCFFHSLIKF